MLNNILFLFLLVPRYELFQGLFVFQQHHKLFLARLFLFFFLTGLHFKWLIKSIFVNFRFDLIPKVIGSQVGCSQGMQGAIQLI